MQRNDENLFCITRVWLEAINKFKIKILQIKMKEYNIVFW